LAEVCAVAERAGQHLLPEPFVDAGVLPQALLAGLSASPRRDGLVEGLLDGSRVIGVAWQATVGKGRKQAKRPAATSAAGLLPTSQKSSF
jgi:hypothetical protein